MNKLPLVMASVEIGLEEGRLLETVGSLSMDRRKRKAEKSIVSEPPEAIQLEASTYSLSVGTSVILVV